MSSSNDNEWNTWGRYGYKSTRPPAHHDGSYSDERAGEVQGGPIGPQGAWAQTNTTYWYTEHYASGEPKSRGPTQFVTVDSAPIDMPSMPGADRKCKGIATASFDDSPDPWGVGASNWPDYRYLSDQPMSRFAPRSDGGPGLKGDGSFKFSGFTPRGTLTTYEANEPIGTGRNIQKLVALGEEDREHEQIRREALNRGRSRTVQTEATPQPMTRQESETRAKMRERGFSPWSPEELQRHEDCKRESRAQRRKQLDYERGAEIVWDAVDNEFVDRVHLHDQSAAEYQEWREEERTRGLDAINYAKSPERWKETLMQNEQQFRSDRAKAAAGREELWAQLAPRDASDARRFVTATSTMASENLNASDSARDMHTNGSAAEPERGRSISNASRRVEKGWWRLRANDQRVEKEKRGEFNDGWSAKKLAEANIDAKD
ncbi:hypothetical protein B0T16DRAFT_384121 [Cercophora newfieldiana]|uniref:Uncharacterized protein n=1 Tax=Cercophora newfieldiana TaxID=92897 RepID=A0AA39YM86_9PEZI|nr:hypothetical protein B0T16DRAFT_384121 [Cercophora newfieldiana]